MNRNRRIVLLVLALAVAAAVAGTYVATRERPPDPVPTVQAQGGLAFAYVDVAASLGYVMRNRTGREFRKNFIIEAMPPGIAVADFNGDGWMDLYCPNGNDILKYDRERKIVTLLPPEESPRNALYWNRGGKRFENGAREAGVDDPLWAFGSIAADLDNDGDPDLYVCNWGPNRLYVNDGTGRFENVADRVGAAGNPRDWSTGAVCLDYDNDGDLDIYVAQYGDVYELLDNPAVTKIGPDGRVDGKSCDWRGLKVYCGPHGLLPLNDVLLENQLAQTGKLEFKDVSQRVGITFVPDDLSRTENSNGPFYGFQPVSWDIDGDGWQDVLVANDSVKNVCWMNQKGKGFVDRAPEMSLAAGMDDLAPQASMGVGCADIDGDGLQDISMSEFSHDQFNLLIGERLPSGMVVFNEKASKTGMRKMTFEKLGWGVVAFDPDNDGDIDLYFSCGHVYPEVDGASSKSQTSYQQTNLLILNEEPKRLKLRDVSKIAGPGLAILKASRAAVAIDYDNDGDLDIATSELNDSPCLLRCDLDRTTAPRHSIQIRLRGNPRARVPLDPAGAEVTVVAGPIRTVRVFHVGSSFMSSEDPRMHFGLGDAAVAERIEVRWPNGTRTVRENVPADQVIEIACPDAE